VIPLIMDHVCASFSLCGSEYVACYKCTFNINNEAYLTEYCSFAPYSVAKRRQVHSFCVELFVIAYAGDDTTSEITLRAVRLNLRLLQRD